MTVLERLEREIAREDQLRKDSEVYIKVRTLDELLDDLQEKNRLINRLREELGKRGAKVGG